MKKFIKPIYAHCDGPCGHYETDTLKNSLETCLKLITKLKAINEADLNQPEILQTFVRLTMIKEEHAQICKEQIYILWSDYFKPAHFEQYPQLMTDLHKAAQFCSQIKQSLSLEAVERLRQAVKVLDAIFEETHQAN